MDQIQIRKRCPSSTVVRRARLDGFELRYSIYSNARKGGVADTFEAPGKSMFGVVYSMNDEDLKALDEIECSRGHYRRVLRKVHDDNGEELEAYCYDVNDKNPDVTPSKVYRWLVYSGAYSFGFPRDYLETI